MSRRRRPSARRRSATPPSAGAARTATGRERQRGEEAEAAPAEEVEDGAEEAAGDEVTLSPERARELEEAEEIILAITDGGFGKRSLAYDYRITGRGGQGLEGMLFSRRTGKEVVATFPVRQGDDVMLVTDTGRLIRLPADQVRLTRRRSLGVMLLRLNEGERVNSCFPVVDDQGDVCDRGRHRIRPGADRRAGGDRAACGDRDRAWNAIRCVSGSASIPAPSIRSPTAIWT